jgi:hypothetical protein
MLRLIGRALVILLLAAVISGGTYALAQTEAGWALLGVNGAPGGFPGDLAQGGQAATGTDGTATTGGAAPSGRPAGPRQGFGGTGQQTGGSNQPATGTGGASFEPGAGFEGGRGGPGRDGAGGLIGIAGILKNFTTIGIVTLVIAAIQMVWKRISRRRQPAVA